MRVPGLSHLDSGAAGTWPTPPRPGRGARPRAGSSAEVLVT